MPSQFLKPTLIAIGAGIPIWIICRTAVRSKKTAYKSSPAKELWLFLFYVYAVSVIMITLAPLPFTRYSNPGINRVNLTPYVHTARGFMATYSPHRRFIMGPVSMNIFGNILLFVPLGILLPLLVKRFRPFAKSLLFIFACTLCIESIQYIEGSFGVYRSVDIDDIILNSLGGIIGLILIRAVYLLGNKKFISYPLKDHA
jgi:glycopeptide antibiotics resistance protein